MTSAAGEAAQLGAARTDDACDGNDAPVFLADIEGDRSGAHPPDAHTDTARGTAIGREVARSRFDTAPRRRR